MHIGSLVGQDVIPNVSADFCGKTRPINANQYYFPEFGLSKGKASTLFEFDI